MYACVSTTSILNPFMWLYWSQTLQFLLPTNNSNEYLELIDRILLHKTVLFCFIQISCTLVIEDDALKLEGANTS